MCNETEIKYTMSQSAHEKESKWSAENPVASAKACHLIMEIVDLVFISIKTGIIRRSTFTQYSRTWAKK